MTLTLEQFLKIIETAALVVGGLWTVWTFYRLQSARTAELDNQTKLNALLRQQPVLAVEIKVAETAWDADATRGFLLVHVSLKNEGDQNLDVFFDDAVLTVGRVVFDKAGHQSIKEQHRCAHGHLVPGDNKLSPISTRIFRAGQKRQLAFSVPIPEPGGYFVEFHAVYQRRPFEGEKGSKQAPRIKPMAIDAVEQAIYFAAGKENKAEG